MIWVAFMMTVGFVAFPIVCAIIYAQKHERHREEELDIIDKLKGTNRHATDWPGPN